MKYKVNVLDGDYSVDYLIYISNSGEDKCDMNDIDKTTSNCDVNNESKNIETDASLCYQIAAAEYEHSIRRMERLDNKIYILLSVCAFIFFMVTNLIENICVIRFPKTYLEGCVVVIYIVLTVGVIIMIGSMLYYLVSSLSSINIKRIDSFSILEKQMLYADKNQVITYIICKMEQAKIENNKLVSDRYDKVNFSIKLLIASIVLLLLSYILGCFVPKVSDISKEVSIVDWIYNNIQ